MPYHLSSSTQEEQDVLNEIYRQIERWDLEFPDQSRRFGQTGFFTGFGTMVLHMKSSVQCGGWCWKVNAHTTATFIQKNFLILYHKGKLVDKVLAEDVGGRYSEC